MQLVANHLIGQGKKIGFVPTMGYLHRGHLSLVITSKTENDITVVSIFVNPTQFAPTEDLAKYPRDYEKDEDLLIEAGVDYLFYPEAQEIYPSGYQTYIVQDKISTILEGAVRPTHFRGVTTVVAILLNAVKPHRAYFGQKDAQQCAVLNRMINDLRFDVEMQACPIVREDDGLAMSSRNVYLSVEERKDALALSRVLAKAESLIQKGILSSERIKSEAIELFKDVESATPDYLEIVELNSFEPVETLQKGKRYFILTACKIGKTRLIDNVLIKA
jgi:pantoate--beta-alanine ligase